MEPVDRITADPEILVGKPIVRGTRLSVEFLLGLMAAGWTHEQILENYPQLGRDDLAAVLRYAGECVARERVYSLPV